MLSLILIVGISLSANASVNKDLTYPAKDKKLTANEIIKQVYFVNHFYSFDNYAIVRNGSDITTLILRSKNKTPITYALERYLRNDYPKGDVVNSKDLALFRSGKLRGGGLLVTDYSDQGKSQLYEVYIKSIRKVRRFAQPASEDAWSGSDFTFGDVVLRKPAHETHVLLPKGVIGGCLRAMNLPASQRNKYTKNAEIKPNCTTEGRTVYKVKSTQKIPRWWYDYRISYVDPVSFVDHRVEYFKNGKMVKFIDKHWVSAGLEDPRSSYWGYWYGKNLITGHESFAHIPSSVSQVNYSYKNKKLWSSRTLRKIPKVVK